MNQHLLIFTDLDGSLLDHHTYSHTAADAMLSQLQQENIPLIPATSKTRAELIQIRQELHLNTPFITENGAAIYIPTDYFPLPIDGVVATEHYLIKPFSEPREHWQKLISQSCHDLEQEYVTFAQAGIDGIMSMTGLDEDAAQAASLREYGEPVKWNGSDSAKALFVERLERAGATVLSGGRFLHVSGNSNKGMALHWLYQQFKQQNSDKHYVSLAIGDSQNDVAMLEAADYALIVRSPVHAPPILKKNKQVIISEALGPQGWAEGVQLVFDRIAGNT